VSGRSETAPRALDESFPIPANVGHETSRTPGFANSARQVRRRTWSGSRQEA